MKIFNKSSIALKLIAGFSFIVFTTVAIGFFTYYRLQDVESLVSNDVMKKAEARNISKDIILKITRVNGIIKEYLQDSSITRQTELRIIISDEMNAINEHMQQIKKRKLSNEEEKIFSRILKILYQYRKSIELIFTHHVSRHEEEKFRINYELFRNLHARYITLLLQFDRIETSLMYESWDIATNSILSTKIYIFILSTLTLILGLSLSVVLIKNLTSPVASLVGVLEKYGNGDFSQRAEITGNDEIGFLAQKFNTMAGQIDKYSNDLQTTYNNLVKRNTEINENKNRLQILTDTIPDAVILISKDGKILDANMTCTEMYNYTRSELTEKNINEINIIPYSFQEMAISGKTVPEFLWTGRKKGNDIFPVKARMRPIHLEDNYFYLAVITDITRQKEMENEMERMQQYLNNIINSMPSALIGINSEGIITLWNQASKEMTGVPVQKAIGKNLWDEFPLLSKFKEHYSDVIEGKTPKQFHRSIKNNNPRRYYDVHLFPLVYGNIKGMVIRADDVTELELSEEALRQAQKMETVGTLAGGIAHDFNNILAGIVGSISLMQHKIENDKIITNEIISKHLQTMDESAQRAVDMVQQLLALSHKQELTFNTVNINDVMKHVKNICSNSFDKSVELNFIFQENPILTNADLTQITQVLLNLCVNGYHAMTMMRDEKEKQGGILSVSILPIYADIHFCSTHPEAVEQDYWVISIHDTGVGLEPKEIAKIFDPFYTTKGKGKGTGLGLAMVYNIVQKHQGFMDVYSEPDIGSTFNFFLPVLYNTEFEKNKEKEYDIPNGEGLILIIDDESSLCSIASSILKDCGYDVIAKTNPIEGVEIFRSRFSDIKAVLLDLVMPRMSGKEVYQEIRKIHPAVKVLLSSGFKKDERVKSLLNMGVNDFLQKPYTLEKLARAINDVISN